MAGCQPPWKMASEQQEGADPARVTRRPERSSRSSAVVPSCLLRCGAIQRSPSSRARGTPSPAGSGTRSGTPGTSVTPTGTTPGSQRTTPLATRTRPSRRTTTRARARTRERTTTSTSSSSTMAASHHSRSLHLPQRRQGAATFLAASTRAFVGTPVYHPEFPLCIQFMIPGRPS
jgi:hypothetical protein